MFCARQRHPRLGLHVVVTGLPGKEIARPGTGLPGVQNSVVIAIDDRCAENLRDVGVARIQRRSVLDRLCSERGGTGVVAPAPAGGVEGRAFSRAGRVIETPHVLSRRGSLYDRTVVNDHRLQGQARRVRRVRSHQNAIDDHQARTLGERQCGSSVRQRDRETARGEAHTVCPYGEICVHVGAICAQCPVQRTDRVRVVGQVASYLLSGDGITEEGSDVG